MKFAHLSDLHIGSWRDPKMRDVSMEVFLKAIDMCVEENVEFILFAGDLFNTALPAVDKLAIVAGKLKEVKDKNIPIYVIPGSHDFSASGKTMIDVLESAGLFRNVCKGDVIDKKLRLRFTLDVKTGAKITGMLGKKGMLDRIFYEDLDREHLEKEEGYKIFMFHTALSELKPKELEQMEAQPVSLLPKGFDYYAGGHVHHKMEFSSESHKKVTQPGALFPNNFAELEKYGHGGFFIVENDRVEWIAVKVKERIALHIVCDGKSPEEITEAAIREIDQSNVLNALVTMRFEGTVRSGKVSDIRFKDIFAHAYYKGAYYALKNTAALKSEEFEEIKVQNESIEDIEDMLIREHIRQVSVEVMDSEREVELTKALISALAADRKDGETVRDFEERIKKEAMQLLEVE